jgi:hypothetical protein
MVEPQMLYSKVCTGDEAHAEPIGGRGSVIGGFYQATLCHILEDCE